MVVTPVISTDLAIALVRAVVGLVIAAHGAQKVLGVWGGPGLAGWTQGVTRMGMAIARAHWGKGFWNSKGGIEFPFTLGAIAAINGVADPGGYSLDRALGLPISGSGVYAFVLVVGVVAYLVGSRAAAAERAKVNPAA